MRAIMSKKDEKEKPVVAICYDFDKTLSPDDMQAQGFIQSLGINVKEFWHKSNTLAEKNGMDQNLAYMYQMSKESIGKELYYEKIFRSLWKENRIFSRG